MRSAEGLTHSTYWTHTFFLCKKGRERERGRQILYFSGLYIQQSSFDSFFFFFFFNDNDNKGDALAFRQISIYPIFSFLRQGNQGDLGFARVRGR